MRSSNPLNEVAAVTIMVVDTDPIIGTTTDAENRFRLEAPIGRQTIQVRCLGFATQELSVLVSSAKETVLEIVLEPEERLLDEVVLASYDKSKTLDPLSFAGGRSFSIDETYRFAGALGDPARMVRSFAGIMPTNDSRNDIVIRGNSPIGVQWILDGIEIPNPNHFNAGIGMTGGQVSFLNTNLLTNSDFHMSAWPATYGNAMAGVFDLTMRKGNSERHEIWGQMGFGEIEVGVEGGLSKSNNSSYLASYRYSIPDLLGRLGILKMPVMPKYQDLTFKLHFDLGQNHSLSWLGLWAQSSIEIDLEKLLAGMSHFVGLEDKSIMEKLNQLIHVNSQSFITGLTHEAKFSPQLSMRSTASFVRNDLSMPVHIWNKEKHQQETWEKVFEETSVEDRYSLHT